MLGFERDCPEDQQIERSLDEIGRLRHRASLSTNVDDLGVIPLAHALMTRLAKRTLSSKALGDKFHRRRGSKNWELRSFFGIYGVPSPDRKCSKSMTYGWRITCSLACPASYIMLQRIGDTIVLGTIGFLFGIAVTVLKQFKRA
jgi:hypothetical protein